MRIDYVTGDATCPPVGNPAIIAHICNDRGGWGRGFVLAISSRWKAPEAEYRLWHSGGAEQGFKLGATKLVDVGEGLWVANMIAQAGTRPSKAGPPIRYQALQSCLEALADEASNLGASVHMPRIGCGLAGGTWDRVETIINDTLVAAGVPVIVYDFDPGPGK